MEPPKPKRLVQKNLLNNIHKAVGSNLFQNLYVIDASGIEIDVFQNGGLSCAAVVSSILAINGLIGRSHATTESVIKDMMENGWEKTDQRVPGSVIEWGKADNGIPHVGFYIDEQTAMSNSSEKGVPVLQGLDMPDGRKPIAFYTHPLLKP